MGAHSDGRTRSSHKRINRFHTYGFCSIYLFSSLLLPSLYPSDAIPNTHTHTASRLVGPKRLSLKSGVKASDLGHTQTSNTFLYKTCVCVCFYMFIHAMRIGVRMLRKSNESSEKRGNRRCRKESTWCDFSCNKWSQFRKSAKHSFFILLQTSTFGTMFTVAFDSLWYKSSLQWQFAWKNCTSKSNFVK